MRRDVEEDCWYVQPRDELRPAASLTVVGHIIVLFRRPFLSRTPFPDSPVCHDTLAWVLGTGAFLPVSILWIFQPPRVIGRLGCLASLGSVGARLLRGLASHSPIAVLLRHVSTANFA